ncbi:uncharacterized protein LOC111321522 [Stylophora pistillata]|uniref:uncharacterized protein LOC111321522 n=1 Tax=Stylophora pistillata TaxID=50429 RepID=UPI000C04C2B5|nr:uncharacterized protein LOC111321522 [Stylophora pistillata]
MPLKTEVNAIRRDLIKPDLDKQCSQLCSSQIPVTKARGTKTLTRKNGPASSSRKNSRTTFSDSTRMRVSLTVSKADKIVKCCSSKLLISPLASIREVAQLVGLMVAYSHGVMYAPLFYYDLDREKTQALKINKGDFDASMIISGSARADLNWWIANVHSSINPLDHHSPNVIVYSDASLTGWGGVCNGNTARGMWSDNEKDHHINYLEIFACFLSLKSLCSTQSHVHIQCMIDNTTAIAYINKMGGKMQKCNEITKQLWLWCMDRNIWLSAAHVPGKENTVADRESRISTNSDLEWQLNPQIFIPLYHSGVNPRWTYLLPEKIIR